MSQLEGVRGGTAAISTVMTLSAAGPMGSRKIVLDSMDKGILATKTDWKVRDVCFWFHDYRALDKDDVVVTFGPYVVHIPFGEIYKKVQNIG